MPSCGSCVKISTTLFVRVLVRVKLRAIACAGTGRRGNDTETRTFVDELSEASAEFRDIWERQEVAVRRSTRKGLIHPEVGALDLLCDVVLSPPTGQRLVLFRPYPGSGTAERLEMLGVLGTQTFGEPG